MSHTQCFIDYYHQRFWATDHSSSGPNSTLEHTVLLRSRLKSLIQKLRPRSILDLGCGDANLFWEMDLEKMGPSRAYPIEYTGFDCVPDLILQTQKKYQDRPHMHFDCKDILTEPLPPADLILCRDVTHYLPNDLITQLLENIRRSQTKTGQTYLLITHNLYSSLSANDVTVLGIFRPVNLTYPPFSWPMPLEILEEDVYGKALALFKL